MKKDFCLLVLSCDKYSDLWPIFFKYLEKNYDLNFSNVYLGTNQKNFTWDRVRIIKSGPDIDWSSSYRKILNQIPERKILVILEDLLPISKIDTEVISYAMDFFDRTKCSHIKYWPEPLPNIDIGDEKISKYSKEMPYRQTVCGFWDKEILLKILIDGENPWQFETFGSYRSRFYGEFYSLNSHLFKFLNLVDKGNWSTDIFKIDHKDKELLSFDIRPMPSFFDRVRVRVKRFIFYSVLKIPLKFRSFAVNLVKKIFAHY